MDDETTIDPIEQLDRQRERAIAAAVRARFGQGDSQQAVREVNSLSERRLSMQVQASRFAA